MNKELIPRLEYYDAMIGDLNQRCNLLKVEKEEIWGAMRKFEIEITILKKRVEKLWDKLTEDK